MLNLSNVTKMSYFVSQAVFEEELFFQFTSFITARQQGDNNNHDFTATEGKGEKEFHSAFVIFSSKQ